MTEQWFNFTHASPHCMEYICKSCGNQFTGRYCNQCGEKVILPEDKSLKALFSSILVAITFADSKVFRTLAYVIRNPGYISKEASEGRTVRYLRPLSLFFVLNLIYFLLPLIQLFNARWKTQLVSTYGALVKYMSSAWMVRNGIRPDKNGINAFELLYNETTLGFAKLMVVVFVVLASLPLNFLYRRSGRLFADHFGLMVELACFNLLVNALFITIMAKVLPIGGFLDETVLTIIFVTTNFYFVLRSTATFYGDNGWKWVIRSLLIVLLLKVALELYRLVLFLVTIWSL